MFRVEDLAELVEKSAEPDSRNREVFAHIRHVADKARVSGWTDDGPVPSVVCGQLPLPANRPTPS